MNGVVFDGEVVYPSKIVCIAKNYVEHINEFDGKAPSEIALFIKPNSSISDDVKKPAMGLCHYEGEITFVIREGKLAGVGFGLDLTLRDIQKKLRDEGLPWEKAKAFDGSAVFSDFVSFDGDILKLGIEFFINGELRQKGDVSLMINKPQEILDDAKRFFTFVDNDLLMTGTPKGVGSFNVGDEFLGRILYGNSVIVEKSWVVK